MESPNFHAGNTAVRLVENPSNKIIPKETWHLVDRLLLEKISAAGIPIVTGIFGCVPEGARCFVPHDRAVLAIDSAFFHKSERIQEVIEAAGCLLEASSSASA